MQKRFIILFFFLPMFLLAQKEENKVTQRLASVKDYRYEHEMSGGLKIQTNGVSLYLTKGWIKNIYKTHLVQAEYQFHINYKDKLIQPNALYDGRKYYYGLQHQFHAIRFSYGFERCIADKAEVNGVRLSFVGFAGFSLGLLKPYYVEIYKGRKANGDPLLESVGYSEGTDSKFMNQDSIYGASPFYKGMNKMIPTFGGHIKLGLNFDWGSKDLWVKAIQAGIMADMYYRKVPIYVNKDANNFFMPALYLSFHFGKRW